MNDFRREFPVGLRRPNEIKLDPQRLVAPRNDLIGVHLFTPQSPRISSEDFHEARDESDQPEADLVWYCAVN